MRITSAGNVGIGTATASAQRLNVVSSAGVDSAAFSDNSYYTLAVRANSNNNGVILLGTAGTSCISLGSNNTERLRIDSTGNVLIGTTSSPTTGTQCLTIETDIAPTATPADTVTFYSSDLSAGNTMPSFYTEGTIVGTGTPTANRTIAVRINGTVYYLLASTIP